MPLVDLQVNGGWGIDFSSPDTTLDEMRACCEAVVASGTAAFLATLVSCDLGTYRRNLPMLARLAAEPTMRGRLLGVHLEGPFLAEDPRVLGAHRAEHVRVGDPAALDELLELSGGKVRMLTLGAEPPGADTLIRHARRRGVVVSIGHSWLTGERLRAARAAGAAALTHLGNALPATLDKWENPLWAGLLADGLTATVVADGHHLSPSALALVIRCKGVDRVVAVSDAAPAAGLPPGTYHVLGQPARLHPDGRLVNEEEGHLVGSTAALVDCLNTLLRLRVADPQDCLRMASRNPLALLGVPAHEVAAGPCAVYDPDAGRFVPSAGVAA